MHEQDPLPEQLPDEPVITIHPKLTKIKGYQHFENVEVGYALFTMAKLYIKRRKTVIRPYKGNKMEFEYWILYRIASKPVWLPTSGNWSFKAVTVDSHITGESSKDPVTERIYINRKNISNFLFDNHTILVYNEIVKSRLFIQRAREKRAEQLRLEQEEREEIEAIARYLQDKETAKLKKTTIELPHEDFVRAHTPKINRKYLRYGEDEGA